jgi:hypothetical protein
LLEQKKFKKKDARNNTDRNINKIRLSLTKIVISYLRLNQKSKKLYSR